MPKNLQKEDLLKIIENEFLKKDYASAKIKLNKLIKFDPNNLRANELLAYIYGNEENIDECLKLLEKLIQRPDCTGGIFYEYGSIARQYGNIQDAISSLLKAKKKLNSMPEVLHELGLAFAQTYKYNEAIIEFQEAINCGLISEIVFFNIGQAYERLHSYSKAIEAYKKSVEINNDFINAWVSLGLCLAHCGSYDQSRFAYQKALQINNNEEYIFGELFYVEMMMCEWKKFNEKIKYIESGLKQNKKVVTPFVTLSLFNSIDTINSANNIFLRDKYPDLCLNNNLLFNKKKKSNKLIIGYFSADFNNHAIAILTS